MTVEYFRGDVPLNRLGIVNTTTKEIRYICLINLPMDVAFCCTTALAYLLLCRSCQLAKASTADVALGIVIANSCILIVGPSEVEPYIVTSCHRYRNMRSFLFTIAMSAETKCIN